MCIDGYVGSSNLTAQFGCVPAFMKWSVATTTACVCERYVAGDAGQIDRNML